MVDANARNLKEMTLSNPPNCFEWFFVRRKKKPSRFTRKVGIFVDPAKLFFCCNLHSHEISSRVCQLKHFPIYSNVFK